MDVKGPDISHPKGMGSKYAYEQIKRAIIEGRLRPDVPVSERDMMEEFAISRTPLREAITRLAAENLVVLRANKSTTVADPIPDGLEAFLTAKVCVDRAVCYSAARRLDQATSVKLKATSASLSQTGKASPGDLGQVMQAIAEAARNRFLAVEFLRLHENGLRLASLNACVDAYRELMACWCLNVTSLILQTDADAAREAARLLADDLDALFRRSENRSCA